MAEDIFGVKFDYGEFEQYGDEEEMEEDYEEDLEVGLIFWIKGLIFWINRRRFGGRINFFKKAQ